MEAHVLSMIALGVSSFVIGTIPLKLARWDQQPFLISLLLCFGGGVVLATSVVHMLTEVRGTIPRYGEIIYCVGFLLLYAIDEIIHSCIGDVHSARASISHSHPRAGSRDSTSDSENSKMFHETKRSYGAIDQVPRKTGFHNDSPHLNYAAFEHEFLTQQSDRCCKKHQKENRGGWKEQSRRPPDEAPDGEADSSESSYDESQEMCHVEVKQQPCATTSMSLPGLLTALFLHALLEGCSIGVQTESSQILLVVAAVASHKLVLAFCLGLELAAAGYKGFKFVLTVAVFSLGCPVGIAIGISLTQSSQHLLFLEAPLQAIAAGSLLYVAVFEVLPRERFKWQHKTELRCSGVYQMIFVVVGFSLITVVDQLAGEYGLFGIKDGQK